MPIPSRAIVIFGDVVASRADPIRSSDWLRQLAAELNAAYGDGRLADFGFTQGDELQGLLSIDVDPLEAVLRAALGPDAPTMRWAVVAGDVDAGRGPATERTGAAFVAAREALSQAKTSRDDLAIVSGDPERDPLLADLGPVLAALLADLTERQREVARLILVDGLRQSEVAAQLGISRPTVSVAAGRARIREIERLGSAIRVLFARGIAAVGRPG